MTIDDYLQTYPDLDRSNEEITACLLRASCIIRALTNSKADMASEPVQRAIAAQTYYLLLHDEDEEPRDCEEVSNAALVELHRNGLLKEMI